MEPDTGWPAFNPPINVDSDPLITDAGHGFLITDTSHGMSSFAPTVPSTMTSSTKGTEDYRLKAAVPSSPMSSTYNIGFKTMDGLASTTSILSYGGGDTVLKNDVLITSASALLHDGKTPNIDERLISEKLHFHFVE